MSLAAWLSFWFGIFISSWIITLMTAGGSSSNLAADLLFWSVASIVAAISALALDYRHSVVRIGSAIRRPGLRELVLFTLGVASNVAGTTAALAIRYVVPQIPNTDGATKVGLLIFAGFMAYSVAFYWTIRGISRRCSPLS
jgi:hypothetical protein